MKGFVRRAGAAIMASKNGATRKPTDTSGDRKAVEIEALTDHNRGIPILRKVVVVFRDYHKGSVAVVGNAALIARSVARMSR